MAFDYDAASYGGGAGAGVGDFLGAIISEIANASTYEEAERLREQAMAEYNIDLPSLKEIQSQAISSQAATAQGSAEAKAARMDALRQLRQRGLEGYTAEDRAAVNDLLTDVDMSARGRREALASRLDPNSGAAISAQMSNAQNASQIANRRGLDLAAQSRRQALSALRGVGDLAGDIDTSEFGQSFARGGAQDAISRFNEGNRLGAAKFNVGTQQQGFANKMGLADRRAGGYRTRADDKMDEARRRSGLYRGAGRAIGGAGGMAAGFMG